MPTRGVAMPSDSPVIITDGSFEAYSAKDDFNNPTDTGKTYRIQKKTAAKAIKFFGKTISLASAKTWTVTVLGSGTVATVAPDPKDNTTLIITATNDLTYTADQMAQVTNSDSVTGISLSVDNGAPQTFQSDCHIKFR